MSLHAATLRTVIADDEPLARERLRFLLASDPELEVVAECRNGNEVVSTLKTLQANLLFLDIQMPGKDGFDVIEEIGLPNMPMTVFVTAHNEYAVEAFALHALDYLVKPIEQTRFAETLERVKKRIQLEEAFAAREEISAAVQALRDAAGRETVGRGPYPERFLAKNGNTGSMISVGDIEWIEAADYYVCLHVGGKKHLLRESIRALEAKLNPNKFVRLHRSAIVNIDHVREIHRDGRTEGWVLLSTGERVRLNKTGWQKLVALNGVS
jgi:two-component system, LytTR family, response regulator